MPTRKEWVVDETGFHAKSVWEPMPSDKTVVNLDDTENSSGNDNNESRDKMQFKSGGLPGNMHEHPHPHEKTNRYEEDPLACY